MSSVTAIARTEPALQYSVAEPVVAITIWQCPAMRSVIAGCLNRLLVVPSVTRQASAAQLLLETGRFRLDIITRVVACRAGLAMRRVIRTFLFLLYQHFALLRRHIRSRCRYSSRR